MEFITPNSNLTWNTSVRARLTHEDKVVHNN